MKNSIKIGNRGECIARAYLLSKDYEIIETNYFFKTSTGRKLGEIDIIAKKNNVYSFVEVKSSAYKIGKNPFFDLKKRVHCRKAEKIVFVAKNWLYFKKIENVKWQIDVISVLFSEKNHELCHLENVFEDKTF
ncbi:MAG: YraN family protein [Candidatus Paceibacterota bacterium]